MVRRIVILALLSCAAVVGVLAADQLRMHHPLPTSDLISTRATLHGSLTYLDPEDKIITVSEPDPFPHATVARTFRVRFDEHTTFSDGGLASEGPAGPASGQRTIPLAQLERVASYQFARIVLRAQDRGPLTADQVTFIK